MAKQLNPANISLLSPKPQQLLKIRRVSSLNVYEGATEAFDPNGLFSVETFGRVGEKTRLITFGYIDAKMDILHPHVFKEVVRLKELYGSIMSGVAYAKWDEKAKDFFAASPADGDTGYAFFMKHWLELKFPRTKSTKRDSTIKMIDENRQDALVRYVLVLPAGLREMEVVDGRPREDEINNPYRRLLAVSQTVNDSVKTTDPINDNVRSQMQNLFNEIYEMLFERMDGKNSYIQSKFMARAVWNATSNVITAMDVGEGDLFASNCPDPRRYRMGLFQYLHSILPRFYFDLREKFLKGKVWGMEEALLINSKTLKLEEVKLDPKTIDNFSSEEGLFKLALRLESLKYRNKPATIKGHYLKLIVEGDGWFYLIDDISDMREEDKQQGLEARPMSWGEVVYYSVSEISKISPTEVTRYPVSGEGSAVMQYVDLDTTTPSLMVKELVKDLEGNFTYGATYPRWPVKDSMSWLESAQAYPSRHKGYGLDHDGDKMTGLTSIAEEVIKENQDYYNSWNSIFGANGELTVTIDMDVSEWTYIGLTNKNVGV